MDTTAYLRRIEYTGPLAPDAETLRRLQAAHLLAVPFENLSIHWREPIILEEAALFEKVVRRRRGGFCYELNGLFAGLLRALGFEVVMLSAGVARAAGGFGPEYDHLTLMVALAERHLVDVGFGDCFRAPLRLDERAEQAEGADAYRVDEAGGRLTLWRRTGAAGWTPQYRFTLRPRALADYAGMCHYHQTSPDSHFTRGRVCSLATADGRVTLSELRLITTKGGERGERALAGEGEFAAVLRERFGIAAGPTGG